MKEQGKAQVAEKEQWKPCTGFCKKPDTYRRRKSLRNDSGKSNA